MPGALARFKDATVQRIASVLQQVIPTSVLGALSGWGETPQFGTALTMASIQQILRTAENGDTWQLFGIYRDMIVNSAHIQTEFGKRVMAVIGTPESIQPIDKSKPDDVQAAEAIEDMIANCDNWVDGNIHLMNGCLWPVAVAEKIFEPVPSSELYKYRHPVRYRLKRLAPVNYALLNYRVAYWTLLQSGIGSYPRYNNTEFTRTNGYSGNGPGSEPQLLSEPSTLYWNADDWEADLRFWNVYPNGQINWSLESIYKPDPNRHVIHRGHTITGFRDTFGGPLRSVLFWWFLSTLGRDWFSKFMGRFGMPFIMAYANMQQKDTLDLLEKAFKTSNTLAGGALIVDQRAKVELKEVMVNGAADGFEKFLNYCNREISKIIVGQELSTVAKGTGLGSGVADLQGNVLEGWREFDERRLGDTQKKQIFDQYLLINGFKGRTPNAIRGGLSEASAVQFTKTLLTTRQAGYKPTAASLDGISQKLGFKIEEAEPLNANPNNRNGQKEPAGASQN